MEFQRTAYYYVAQSKLGQTGYQVSTDFRRTAYHYLAQSKLSQTGYQVSMDGPLINC